MCRLLLFSAILCLASACKGDELLTPAPRNPDHVDSSQAARAEQAPIRVAGPVTALL